MFFNPVFIFVGLEVTPEMPETPAFPREQMLRLRHVPFCFAVIMHERVGHFREKKTKQNTSCKVGTGDR